MGNHHYIILFFLLVNYCIIFESKVIEDIYPLPQSTQLGLVNSLGPECALIEQNVNSLSFSDYDWSIREISKVKTFFKLIAEEFKVLDNNTLYNMIPTFKLQQIIIIRIKNNPMWTRRFYNDTYDNKLPFGVNEYYDVRVFEGSINVYTYSVYGAMQAIKTLLLSSVAFEDTFCIKNIPYRIVDEPRFPYRGLLLDTGRSYFTIDYIKSIIRGISILKFNILHWHLTDDQSFSLEIGEKKLKNLHLKGANHLGYIHNDIKTKKGAFYKQKEIFDLERYANKWGVRLIPEIDIPAHSRSWGIAFSNLTAKCPDLMQNTRFNQVNKEYTFSVPLDISLDFTYTVIETIIEELMDIFQDPYLHLGGDEVDIRCWAEDKELVQRMELLGYNNPKEYIKYFKKRMNRIINKKCKGKTIIQWEDILEMENSEHIKLGNKKSFISDLTENGTPKEELDSDDYPRIYQMWKGDTKLLNRIKKNKEKFIWSFGNYLDPSYQSCKTFEDCYNQDKLDELERNYPDEFIGVEACAWEMVQEDNIKGTEKDGSLVDRSFSDLVWYKLIAISEKIWTNPNTIKNPILNTQFIQRAQLLASKLQKLGISIGNHTISNISIS